MPQINWTYDTEGRSNASQAFMTICAAVEKIIVFNAGMSAATTSRMIVAQLAHVHGLAPAGLAEPALAEVVRLHDQQIAPSPETVERWRSALFGDHKTTTNQKEKS